VRPATARQPTVSDGSLHENALLAGRAEFAEGAYDFSASRKLELEGLMNRETFNIVKRSSVPRRPPGLQDKVGGHYKDERRWLGILEVTPGRTELSRRRCRRH
jgi:hypothetical protein